MTYEQQTEEGTDMRKFLQYTWSDMTSILEFKTLYAEIVESKAISVPKANKELNVETAKWFIDNGHKFNKRASGAYLRVFDIAHRYLELSNVNRSSKV